MEATLRKVREHLGAESQRRWSDGTINCPTPSLTGLLSIVALWANSLFEHGQVTMLSSARYQKWRPTFSDALNAVRKQIWQQREYCMSDEQGEIIKMPKALFGELADILARAA